MNNYIKKLLCLKKNFKKLMNLNMLLKKNKKLNNSIQKELIFLKPKYFNKKNKLRKLIKL